MNTNDIIESLNMAAISQQPIANTLLHQIADALKEREASEKLLSDWQKCQERIKADGELIEVLKEEREALRAVLRQIGQGVACDEPDQLETWVAGIVDAALGDELG